MNKKSKPSSSAPAEAAAPGGASNVAAPTAVGEPLSAKQYAKAL